MSEEAGGDGGGGVDDGSFSLTTEQEAALALENNLAITAGAGTGKTTTLKERYRTILRRDPDVSPLQILTLTFTNDATNEMRDRIRDVIDAELAAADRGEYDRWRRAKDDLEDAYVHTIHGFCSRVLREFAVEAGVHPDFETLDEGDAGQLIERAITTVLDRYGVEGDRVVDGAGRMELDGNDPTEPEQWDWDVRDELVRLTRLYSRSGLESALSSLHGERPESTEWADRWADRSPADYLEYCAEFVEVSIAPEEADELFERDEVRAAIDELRRLDGLDLSVPEDDDGMAVLGTLAGFLEETGAHTDEGSIADRQRFLLEVADAVTTGDGALQSQTWRYAGSKRTWRDNDHGEERAALEDALDSLTAVVEPESRNLDHDPAVSRRGATHAIALARVFQAVRSEYRRTKRRRNALDYSDLITETIAFLEDEESARATLRDQFEFVMVDEVQDTDPRQWRLVRLLSGDDPDRFDGRNVFLVGDEKQSIYRFRNADVTQFRRARSRLVDDNPAGVSGDLELTGNFRTLESTLTVINELFEAVLEPASSVDEAEGDGSPGADDAYEPYEARPQSLDSLRSKGASLEGFVEYLVVPDDDDADGALGLEGTWFTDGEFVSRAEREAKALAARLTRLFDDGIEVYDPGSQEYTTARPRHVALLFRSSRRMTAFDRQFDAHDIPYTNLAGSGFYDTPEIVPLVNLLEVFEDPTADIPLYGVLRSPLFGFTDAEIAAVRRPDHSLWECLGAADGALARARDRIGDWRTETGLDGAGPVCRWSTLLSRIIDETGYLIAVGADERPQQAVANVEKFREQLRNWEEAEARSVTALIDRVQRAREGEEDPSEATVPGDIEGVQLRTIHSAKGLEFPIVVVPEVTRKFNVRSPISKAHLERIDDEPVLGMKAPAGDDVYNSTDTAAYLHVRDHHRRRERAEQRRLLYVAATRARDHLLFSGTHGVDPETDSGLPEVGDWAEAGTWIDWVQPTLLDRPDLVDRLAAETTLEASIGDGSYSISRPTPPSEWSPPGAATDVPTDVEIPAPPRTRSRRRLSATGFRDWISAVPSRDRPAVLREADTDFEPGRERIVEDVSPDGLESDTIGTVVHKLCELALPRSAWPEIVGRCVDDPGSITDEAIEVISRHAETGLEAMRELEADSTVTSRHGEFPVSLELPSATVVGDIDHLSVTETGYVVVDYKTSDLASQSVAELTEHYLPQLLAYAGALVQQDDSAERVDIALVFTDTGEVGRRTLTREEVFDLLAWADGVLDRESQT